MTTTLTAAPQPRGTIIVGDALSRLQELETSSIDCVITSPPYFRLRNYQHHQQLGLEDGQVPSSGVVSGGGEGGGFGVLV